MNSSIFPKSAMEMLH